MSARSQQTVVFTDTDIGGIIHIANIKGGVGKSTVATNLAAALSKKGPTLLVDLDVQGSASVALGVDSAACNSSSWDLFRKRFSAEASQPAGAVQSFLSNGSGFLGSSLFPFILGKGEITSVAINIDSCLDLIPANNDLFKPIGLFQLQNFLFNMALCRNYYKYIVLDTPSVWNNLTRTLYRISDLNLIPVTLNALSTKSLRDYLWNVKNLAEKQNSVRIRVIKNEVFGSTDSKIKGKTRTMNENRKFLENLCEKVTVRNPSGIALLPQSILLDLEIPESAIVRDAQDEGKAVGHLHQYAAITRAFDELAKRVQYVLNSYIEKKPTSFWESHADHFFLGARFAAVALILLFFGLNLPVRNAGIPRPIAPQQLVNSPERVFEHSFQNGESLFKIAKYAICKFRAVVPRMSDVHAYVAETAEIHNRTRLAGEPIITSTSFIEPGTVMRFYPPDGIANPKEKELIPVYEYFTSLVRDPFAYITGDWCERGFGGGSPHYGLDVAAALGSRIVSPVDGIAILHESRSEGRVMGIVDVNDGTVIYFLHLDQRFFRNGDEVRKNDIIATVGMTGATSGPHAHIGYGIRSLGPDGILFGRTRYKITDPKLFFYREAFISNMLRS